MAIGQVKGIDVGIKTTMVAHALPQLDAFKDRDHSPIVHILGQPQCEVLANGAGDDEWMLGNSDKGRMQVALRDSGDIHPVNVYRARSSSGCQRKETRNKATLPAV